MGLVRGHIPVCNPQRTVITEQQSDLIENIENSTTKKAGKLIEENFELVSDFMSKVNGSIKMVVQLYNNMVVEMKIQTMIHRANQVMIVAVMKIKEMVETKIQTVI